MNRRPPLRFTSPHILNSLIFPLDTAKNHRLNSIAHRYYWQRLFMQLTAHYLSHSLLASILIREKGERGEWQRAERNDERKKDRERKREWVSDKGERGDRDKRGVRKERDNLTWGSQRRPSSLELQIFWLPRRLVGKHFCFDISLKEHSNKTKRQERTGGQILEKICCLM